MTVPCIELADPGREGQRIAEVLRERGFYVVERSIESLRDGTEAALLLLAGDAEGALDALGKIRSAPSTVHTPCILLGAPPGVGKTSEIVALGADGHYGRPVPIERLVRKVETFLAPPETRLKSLPAVGDGGGAQREPARELGDPPVAEWRPPERTMQLDADEVSAPLLVDSHGTHGEPVEVSGDGGRRRPTLPPAPSEHPEGTRADLSPRLRRLILDADRRVFPSSPPLDLRFPAGDEPAHDLVPDELLETVSLPSEQPVEEDPLEAFTYLGPVPEHAATPLPGGSPDPNKQWLAAPSEPDEETAPPVRTAATFAPPRGRPETPVSRAVERRPSTSETQDEIGLGELTGGGRGRKGELGEADALRLLWRVVETGDDVWITLELEGGAALRLRVVGGELGVMEGPVAERALAQLRARHRTDADARDEQEAVAALERAVAEQRLGRFELDRLLRLAREELLHDAVASSGGRFEMRPGAGGSELGPRLLAAPLPAVLFEGARRRLTATRVRRLLGSGALSVRLTPIARLRFERAALEPELIALLERCDGATVDALLAAAPPEEGVAGALFALVAASAIRLVSADEDVEVDADPAGAVRAAVEAAAVLAEDSHYFGLLGVRPDAAPRELRAAYEARRQELRQLRLSLHGLDDLEPRRRLALSGLDEAWEVLRDERLREAYRHALGL